jgi:hypothetical protein
MSCYENFVACFCFKFPYITVYLDLYILLVQRRAHRLHNIGMTGVHRGNGQELCSATVGPSDLESSSIRSEGMPAWLLG